MKNQSTIKNLLKEDDYTCCEANDRKRQSFHPYKALPIFRIDQGILVYVNLAWEKLTGYSKTQVLNKPVCDLSFIASSDINEILKELDDVGLIESRYIDIVSQDGNELFVLANFQRIHIDGKEIIQCFVLDFRKCMKTSNSLIQVKNFCNTLLDHMNGSLVVLDENMVCVKVNKSYTEMTDFKPEDIVGQKPPFPHWPEEEYEKIKTYVDRFLDEDTTKEQLTFKKANGERFETVTSTTEILDHKDNLVGYISSAIDISYRLKYYKSCTKSTKQAVKKKDSILKLLGLLDYDFDDFLKKTTAISAEVLGVKRVSVWKFVEEQSKLKCLNAYHIDIDDHKNSTVLETKNYPNYIQNIRENKTIKMENAKKSDFHKDYKIDYLDKFGIKSMLDIMIKGINEPFGILCFEQLHEKRSWTASEEQYATTIASIIALAVEKDGRIKIEKELIKANEKLVDVNLDLNKAKISLEQENVYLRKEIDLVFNYEEMVYGSAVFSEVLTAVEKVAETDATVLISGESGTGKELIARAIHNVSGRSSKPLVKVNCAAIPRELIESELFGHKKGSFTGAFSDKDGKFKLADGGTLFLDEIGELPLDMQPKLLRAIQEYEIEPIGSSKLTKVDIRIIVATNRNLKEEVEKGNFREDLFFRLNVFPIHIPPLRERPEDIGILIEHFVDKYGKRYNKNFESISKETKYELQKYDWPGNIRELENLIERAVILSNQDVLIVPGFTASEKKTSITTTCLSLDDMQRIHIEKALKLSNWKISGENGASNLLDVKPSTLRDKMKKFKIKKP